MSTAKAYVIQVSTGGGWSDVLVEPDYDEAVRLLREHRADASWDRDQKRRYRMELRDVRQHEIQKSWESERR